VEGAGSVVDRCRAGDAAAFAELFRSHRAEVARVVHRMLGPSPDLEDVVQEVFFQVHRSIGSFNGRARFTTWLYRVSVNVVLMHRRAARSRPVLGQLPEGVELADPRPLPEEALARSGRIAAFFRLLDRLSEKKRTVFVLHDIEGLTAREIGDIVKAPVLTIRTRLFYARREIEAMLSQDPTLAPLLLLLAGSRSAQNGTSAVRKEQVS
jgi:RNA polymerase sigma-70 factor (ECF subfamily)